jgi:Uma2 family endonuclease
MAIGIRTAEELERAGDIGPCELVRGELVMMMPPGGRHGKLANLIAHRLTAFVADNNLGTILAETGFVLSRDPDTVRAPDVVFLRTEREIGDGFIDGAPELAVEVVSPGDRTGYLREEVAEWLEAGAEAVWVVDPRARTVTMHEGARGPRVLEETDTLDGGRVLPGFTLDLRELFG